MAIHERHTEYGTSRFYESDSGVKYTNHDCMRRAEAGLSALRRWFARAVKTRTDWHEADMQADEYERLRSLLDQTDEWTAAMRIELDRLEGLDRRRERIKALRQTKGRTPEEAALYREGADRLAAKLNAGG